MKYFFKVIVQHKWAAAMAVLVGIIMALPHIYFCYHHADVYRGIMMGGLDEGPYVARIREVRDGHYLMANPFWAEGKNAPHLWPPLSENVASLVGSIFGLNVINTVLLGNFIFPFFIFLFIYFLIYGLSQKKSIALLTSLIILLTPNLTNPGDLWRLLFMRQTTDTFLAYSRLISPQIHSFFFFFFFLCFWIFWEKRQWFYGIVSGLILGLTFYVYPFAWMFIGATLGFLIAISAVRKQWHKIKDIFLLGSLSLVIALPFFHNLWRAMHSPFYTEVSLRYGWVLSRQLQAGATMVILLGLFLLLFPRRWRARYDFCLAIVLAPFLMLNQQIVTGYLLGPARQHCYYYKPFAVIFLMIIIADQLNKRLKKNKLKKIAWSILTGAMLVISFLNVIVVQTRSYRTNEGAAIANQRYAGVFEWLNNHSCKDEVVLTDGTFSDFIPIYTSLNTVINFDAHYSLVSDDQLLERMFLEYRLNGLRPENAAETFFKDRENISKKIFAQRYQKQFGTYDQIPNEKLYYFAEKYKKFYNISENMEDIIKKYQTKYFIWDAVKQPEWTIDKYNFLHQTYEVNGIKIYEVNEK